MASPRAWDAQWVALAYDPREDIGVFALQNRFNLREAMDHCVIRVSADQRYKLFVNGLLIGFGPQRGDLAHWFYETYDLAPFLAPGENLVEAVVWNFGRWAPMAQLSARTGFVCETEVGSLNTPGEWRIARLKEWEFDMMHAGVGEFYIDVGPGEVIGAGACPAVGDRGRFSGLELAWREPHVICTAEERGVCSGGTPWMLVPRTLPPMLYEVRAARPKIRSGWESPGLAARVDDGDLVLPIVLEHGECLLLDYGELLCAYPRIACSGSGEVVLTYAEGLWHSDGRKGNRNDVAGKQMLGYQDVLRPADSPREFEPLWFRTYRYLQLEVRSGPVTIDELDAVETGYPMKVESSFEADDPWVRPMWVVSIRTAERCAGETYFDCPYYEQLQYIGDTRIQALIGYYLGRDRALQRNAVETLCWSLKSNGLTQSRYPSRHVQIIPPFSLWWVMMLWDQMMYDSQHWDPLVDRRADLVLMAFSNLAAGETDSFWCFGDWVPNWQWGVPEKGCRSEMHYLTHVLASVLNESRENGGSNSPVELVSRFLGDRRRSRELFGQEPHSEHVEALYRLCQVAARLDPDPWPTEALAQADAAACTYYFSYYKHLAMFGRPGDLPFDYLQVLDPWKEMIEDGLTTFAENPEPTRSDCHAWSAHPILGFFQIVAGVTSGAPGWTRAQIAPHPGSLQRFDARIAHPDGELRVLFEQERLHIESPVAFDLRWRGESQAFEAGIHAV